MVVAVEAVVVASEAAVAAVKQVEVLSEYLWLTVVILCFLQVIL
jgi:hypothetical protein